MRCEESVNDFCTTKFAILHFGKWLSVDKDTQVVLDERERDGMNSVEWNVRGRLAHLET